MQPLISVIVPIYNVEAYLEECVNSIIGQTYRNLEIILVDDGSPDNCGAICDEYAAKDNRIKVIHKPNGGISDARNAGMAIAKGEYLMFVDSDDWIESDAIALLYEEIMAHDAQLAVGGMRKIDDTTKEILYTNYSENVQTVCPPKTSLIEEHLRGGGWGPWGKLYRTDIHKNILFPVGETNEDEAIALQIIDSCEKIVKTNALVYNYRSRPNSICTSEFSVSNLDWYKHCKADVDWIHLHYPELEQKARRKLFSCIQLHLAEIAVAKKQYRCLANPLLEEVRIHYKAMKKHLQEKNESTYRLMMYRYLPYSFYCFAVKLWWGLRHGKSVGN